MATVVASGVCDGKQRQGVFPVYPGRDAGSVRSPCLAQSDGAAPLDFGRGKPALSVRAKFIDQRIAEFMEKNDVPGLAMAIVQAPYIPRSAGYGRASLADDDLASTRTMWNIGPLTQAFTAVAIFQLHEAQKLDIRGAIGKYLPKCPPPGRRRRSSSSCSMHRASPTSGPSRTSSRPGLQARRSGRAGVGQAASVRAGHPGPHERDRLCPSRPDHRTCQRHVFP